MMKKMLFLLPMLFIGFAVMAQTAVPDSKKRMQVYEKVDEMPKFPGCSSNYSTKDACTQKAISDFIQRNLRYPQDAIDAKVEGKVIVNYIVDTKGNINIETIGYSTNHFPSLDAEAVRVTEELRKLSPFVPGKKDGKLVNVMLLMNIDFKLPK
jgi:bla regulator protein blaR1